MKSTILPHLALLCLASLTCAQVSDVWITQITDDDFGSDIVFNCNTSLESNQPPNGSFPVRWMFNDLTNEEVGYNGTKQQISDDGWQMTIKTVSKEDFGVYHCMMMTQEMEWYLIKLGLNVRGPYYQDLWEKYRSNTITGISSFLIFLACAVGTIFTYKYFQNKRASVAPISDHEIKYEKHEEAVSMETKVELGNENVVEVSAEDPIATEGDSMELANAQAEVETNGDVAATDDTAV